MRIFVKFLFIDFAQEKKSIQFDKNYVFSLKTSLLKWRPDYDSAADEYNKAGKLIKLLTVIFVISKIFSVIINKIYSNGIQKRKTT